MTIPAEESNDWDSLVCVSLALWNTNCSNYMRIWRVTSYVKPHQRWEQGWMRYPQLWISHRPLTQPQMVIFNWKWLLRIGKNKQTNKTKCVRCNFLCPSIFKLERDTCLRLLFAELWNDFLSRESSWQLGQDKNIHYPFILSFASCSFKDLFQSFGRQVNSEIASY